MHTYIKFSRFLPDFVWCDWLKNSIPFKTYRYLLKQQWLKKLGPLTNSTVKYFTLQKNTNMLFVQSDFKFSVFKTRRGVLYIYSLLFTFVGKPQTLYGRKTISGSAERKRQSSSSNPAVQKKTDRRWRLIFTVIKAYRKPFEPAVNEDFPERTHCLSLSAPVVVRSLLLRMTDGRSDAQCYPRAYRGGRTTAHSY